MVGQALIHEDLRRVAPLAVEQAKGYLQGVDVRFTNLETALAPKDAAAAGYMDTPAGKVALVAMASGASQLAKRDTWAGPGRPGVNYLDLRKDGTLDPEQKARILAAVREAARQAKFVIVYQHTHFWGEATGIEAPPNRETRVNRFDTPGWLVAWTHELIDAGATLYVAHGNPALHGVEIYKGRPILYGLGNYIFNTVNDMKYMNKSFSVVGIFESQGGGFESEIWGDFDVLGAMFNRGAGSNSVTVRMKDASQISALDKWIRASPRCSSRPFRKPSTTPTRPALSPSSSRVWPRSWPSSLGVGAVFGAMNTMYAVVASRTREIGTLRALGFSRRSILYSFVMESVVLALLAGAIGCLLAWPMDGFSTGTAQTRSFSEMAFSFQLTPAILITGMVFAGLMGLIGGLLPARRAARMPITRALRDAWFRPYQSGKAASERTLSHPRHAGSRCVDHQRANQRRPAGQSLQSPVAQGAHALCGAPGATKRSRGRASASPL